MSHDSLKTILSAPLFSRLSEDEARTLLKAAQERSYQAQQSIFLIGEVGEEMFIVKTGKVELFLRDTTGEKLVLGLVEEQGVFGELALLDQGPRSASAVALEKTDVLVIDHEAFQELLNAHPGILKAVLIALGDRIRNANALLQGHHVQNANDAVEEKLSYVQRIASWISDFSGSLPFLALNALFFLVWILWNTDCLPWLPTFDPYPFGFLTMAVSLEAIFLSIIVLLAQNLESTREKIRSDIEYHINLKAELEVTHLHSKVDLMHAEMLAGLNKIEKRLK